MYTTVLGVLLGVLLIGLSVLIRRDHVTPHSGVMILAQLTAAAFGTGWPYYATSLVITLVRGLAANTSFGGLPVLMSLLAQDNRLPHLFALRAERPVHRYGVVFLALLSLLLLIAVNADTQRLIPLFAIGVFVGFTISQLGLVRHWMTRRPEGWVPRVLVNATGAVLSGVAGAVLLATKFLAGAWFVVVMLPLLMLLFARIQRYYTEVGTELALGRTPRPPTRVPSLVIVPLGRVDAVAERAVAAALSLGDAVVVVAVFSDRTGAEAMRAAWDQWSPTGVRLDIVDSPHHSLVHPVVSYVERACRGGRQVAVLVPQVEPRHRRYRILQNQRGILLATVLSSRTDAVVCLLPYRLGL
ncbi:amino acid permease [Streptomyces sp. NPDC048192]|uniref:amino acid permease n=1 Tax=Streptomyces sp. NPDC048192 TaxID=3365510 RepID=UPI003713EBBF